MLEGILHLRGVDALSLVFLGVFLLVGVGIGAYGVANLRTSAQLQSMTPRDAHAVGSPLSCALFAALPLYVRYGMLLG